MMNQRIAILGKDLNQARRFAIQNHLSHSAWVYVSSHYNLNGLKDFDYVKLPGADERPDFPNIWNKIQEQNGKEITLPQSA